MNRRKFLLQTFALSLLLARGAHSEDGLNRLNKRVQDLLQAYNSGDSVKFWACWKKAARDQARGRSKAAFEELVEATAGGAKRFDSWHLTDHTDAQGGTVNLVYKTIVPGLGARNLYITFERENGSDVVAAFLAIK